MLNLVADYAMIIITILVFILIFGLIVFVHELGHFLVAKRTGVVVEEFAFGFPPKIFAWKRGETRYAINLLPLGGYVKLKGEDGGDKEAGSFVNKKARVRASILLAGIVMNLILSWVILTVIIILPKSVRGDGAVFVSAVLENTPAAEAGIKTGDAITKIDNLNISDGATLHSATQDKKDSSIKLNIRRNGNTIEKNIKLSDGDAPLGVATSTFSLSDISVSAYNAPVVAIQEIGRVIWGYIQFFGGIFGIGSTEVSADSVSGPVGIYGVVAQFVALGWVYVLFVTAQLSLAIAIFNLIPFPALDGGRVLFVFLKKIFKGKYITLQFEQIAHTVGFFILMGMFAIVTYRDILKLIK